MLEDGIGREAESWKRWRSDGGSSEAVVVSKTRREISRPVNKLYPTESIENKETEINDASEIIATQNCQRRETAVIGILKDVLWWGSVKVYILSCIIKDNFSIMRN